MKNNINVITIMLCTGLLSLPVQAMQTSQPESTQESAGWKNYISSGLSSAYQKAGEAAGYVKGSASSMLQSGHQTIKEIGYQKVATAIMTLMTVANWYGFGPVAVLSMVKDFVSQPDLLKRAGQAAIATGGMVVSGASAVASSPYTAGAAKLGGLYYLGQLDAQNKYDTLALQAIKKLITNQIYSNEVKEAIAKEVSNRVAAIKGGDSNVTLDDFTVRLEDDQFLSEVLVACLMREEKNSQNRQGIMAIIKAFSALEDGGAEFKSVVTAELQKRVSEPQQSVQQGQGRQPLTETVVPLQQQQVQSLQQEQQKPTLFGSNPYGTNSQQPYPPMTQSNSQQKPTPFGSNPYATNPRQQYSPMTQYNPQRGPYTTIQGGVQKEMNLENVYQDGEGRWFGWEAQVKKWFVFNPKDGFWYVLR